MNIYSQFGSSRIGNVKVRDFRRFLQYNGYSFKRQSGSHEIWTKPNADNIIVPFGKSGTVPDNQKSLIARMIQQQLGGINAYLDWKQLKKPNKMPPNQPDLNNPNLQSNNKQKIVISKSLWTQIGLNTGWLKIQNNTHTKQQLNNLTKISIADEPIHEHEPIYISDNVEFKGFKKTQYNDGNFAMLVYLELESEIEQEPFSVNIPEMTHLLDNEEFFVKMYDLQEHIYQALLAYQLIESIPEKTVQGGFGTFICVKLTSKGEKWVK